jgi:ribokinase
VKESVVRESRNIFVTSLVSEKNFALFLKLVKLARKHSRPIVFAPSISMLRRWLPQLLKIHTSFSVSIFNYEEGSFYTGKDRLKDILRRLPGNVDVLSKDVEGAYAKEGSSFFHVKTLPVKIFDTCGAGDAFSGAFAHYYCHGEKGSVGSALANAVGVAALKVATKGSRLNSSSRKIASFLAENRSKLKVQKV